MNEQTPIPILLTVPQVNMVLSALGKRPLEEVLDLFNSIKSPADEGVRMALLKAQTAAAE